MTPPPTRLTFLRAGYCRQSEHLSLRSAPRRPVTYPALCTLIERQGHAPILYDSGYAPDTESPPTLALKFYSRLLKPRLPAGELISEQLAQRGIDPLGAIDLILSHFHPDHIGGANSLPQARIHCFREAYQSAAQSAFPALTRGFFRQQLPKHFSQKTHFLEDDCPQVPNPLPGFEPTYQLLGDPNLLAVKLHGHARAQLGLIIRGPRQNAFLVADAAWSSQAIRENRPPSQLTRLAQHNWRDLTQTLHQLHQLKTARPDWHLVPSHCPEYATLGTLEL